MARAKEVRMTRKGNTVMIPVAAIEFREGGNTLCLEICVARNELRAVLDAQLGATAKEAASD